MKRVFLATAALALLLVTTETAKAQYVSVSYSDAYYPSYSYVVPAYYSTPVYAAPVYYTTPTYYTTPYYSTTYYSTPYYYYPRTYSYRGPLGFRYNSGPGYRSWGWY